MKRILAALVVASVSLLAHAGPTTPADIRWTQNNENDPSNGQTTRYLSIPAPGSLCAAVLNGTTRQPGCYTLGSGLTVSGTSITSDGVSMATMTSALTGYPTNGTLASALAGKMDVPAGSTGQYLRGDGSAAAFPSVVLTSDPRLTDARTPLAHTHTASQISDSTSIGRTLLTASDAAAVRTAIDAYPASTNPSGYITQTGARSAITLTTTGSGAATYNASTGALNVPTPAAALPRSKTSVTKAVGGCFQLSTTRDAYVSYNVEIIASLTLIGGQRGTLYLETFTDSACTTGTEEIMRSTNGNTSGLAVALGNVSTQTLNVHGWVMAGLYAKLRTVNDTGTPTYSARPGQEVLQ